MFWKKKSYLSNTILQRQEVTECISAVVIYKFGFGNMEIWHLSSGTWTGKAVTIDSSFR